MGKQLYWEDVKEGDKITSLSKVGTRQMLVRWAGAVGDFQPVHYDDSFAEAQGVGKPIIHGPLKSQWLIQMLTNWMGDEGFLRKFSTQYRAMDWPRLMKTSTEPHEGETWTCKGKVTKKYTAGDEHLVDCDIQLENGKDEVTTPGRATVILPSRG